MFKSINGGKLPLAQTKYSAGYDVYANEDKEIKAGETRIIPLGVKIDSGYLIEKLKKEEGYKKECGTIYIGEAKKELCEKISKMEKKFENFAKAHYLGLYLRSSLGAKGLILPNGVGIIDIDYKDELKMIIHNPLTDSAGYENKSFFIKRGDRIGQIIIHSHYGIDILGNDFRVEEERKGGIGSTNKEEKR